MGIKYFFKWLKTNHSESIKCIDRHDNSQCIDVLLIDMNGIIHNSAQEVYGYGSFSFPKEMLAIRKFIHWCVDRLTEWLYNSNQRN